MHPVNGALRNKLERIAQQILGIELALLVMLVACFLLMYVVR